MSKGGKQTSTQKTELPAYVTQAQQNLISSGQSLTAPFLQTPKYSVAGFNTDQLKGFDLARGMAQDAFTTNPVRGVPGEAALSWPAALASTTNANAAQVNGNDIQAAMNPYIGSVVNGVVDQLGQNYRDQDAQIGAQAAASQAFGGSGEALRRSRLSSDTQKTMADTVSQLLSAGYDRATATALANAQMRQQAELTNAGAANNTSQFNSSATNAINQFNAGQKNSFDLAAPQLEAALASGNQQRQMSALQQLLGIGSQQQQLAQGAIDVPFTALQRLAGTVPSQTESTTTSTQPKQGGGVLGQLLGTGLSILGMPMTGGGSIAGSLFSDRREKTDIKKLGHDPQTGEMLYAYRYKDDPKSYPKVVGPMAQDIEKSDPGRVREIGGKKIVRA